MSELLGQYWWLFLIALLIGISVAWLIFANRTRRVPTSRASDILDEGAAPAQRNQALINAPPAAAPPVSSPSPPAAAPGQIAPGANGAGDDLTRIKGVGPKLVQLLGTLGITEFAQIAEWTDADIERIDSQLGNFQGRIRRDNWVEQAAYLAEGDTQGFESRFGKL